MARYGRAYPAPTRRIGPNFKGIHQDIALGSFALDWSFPPLTVVSPSVTLPLPTFSLDWSFPSLGLAVALPTFSLTWEWPSIQAVVPPKPGDALTGLAGQVEWNGHLWGAGTAVAVQQIDGWRSLPPITNSNVERPSRHGAWDARKLAQQRIITIRLRLDSIQDPSLIDDLLDELDAATGVPEDDLPLPLVIKGYGQPKLAYGHIIERDVPMNEDWSVGAPTAAIQIVCGDPRHYSLLRHGVTVPYGEPTVLTNAGNTAAHPTLRVPGPAVDPVLTNQTLGRTIQFSITLSGSERLDIDPYTGNVTVGAANRMSTLTGSSVPVQDWVLGSGANTILYTASSGGAAGLDVLWRDATL